jgi:hypothetical protein
MWKSTSTTSGVSTDCRQLDEQILLSGPLPLNPALHVFLMAGHESKQSISLFCTLLLKFGPPGIIVARTLRRDIFVILTVILSGISVLLQPNKLF